ncbi:BnaC05g50840D [Brassica napus]|uniref:(rape) hypothetical protein n=1 Tax=Brassica napus TaxID=3708 RepID=A0A078JUJ2_BRANA|nr:unnamed protein product [Brassica napus]CDY69167.1 BnaC05g50840D [Brassica napus]
MQVAFPSSPPSKSIDDERLTEMSMMLSEDFTKKLGFSEEGEDIRKLERSWSKLEDSVEFHEEEEAGDEEEEEFSFACVNAEGSPITAEEAFEDGQIRPAFPLFNRALLFDQNDAVSETDEDSESIRPRLRKVFVEDRDGDGEGKKAEEGSLGAYCSWSGGTVAEASPETCRKSNSTGFSKLWRFRDLVLRSNSDGRDAFVFLNNSNAAVGDKTQSSSSSSRAAKLTSEDDKEEKKSTKAKKGKEKEKEKTTSSEKRTKSAHEKLYMRNRALKEEVKHRSYLPYKQVGFFTNVNGLSRNIHPF